MENAHKSKTLFIWNIVLACLFIFMLVTTLVLTQNKFIYNTINSVMGGEKRYIKSGDPSEYTYYKSDYANKNEVLSAANALNEQICSEGIILLKNEKLANQKSALPLAAGQKITVFGRNSIDLVLGGSGSSAVGASSDDNLYTSLTAAGFNVNPILKKHYETGKFGSRPVLNMGDIVTGYPIVEAPLPYPQSVKDSYASYNEAALVVISRIGGEGYDLPRTMFWDGRSYENWENNKPTPIPGAQSMDSHYLQLDKNETAMIQEAGQNFKNVIVIINSSSTIELDFLNDPANNVKAALWIGHPGAVGIRALGNVLNGSVNPSGKTVDTFVMNFRNDPSWENFGNNLKNEGNRYFSGGAKKNAYFVEYREGIYTGYRYYETRGFTEGETWYDENVVFPFGYGQSYTTFDWTVEKPENAGEELREEKNIEINVAVKNTGTLAGKEVVQLYYTAPYIDGGIEKSHVVLGDFVKTDLLAPQESQTVTLKLKVRDMASYDYNDANKNGFSGYELDAGDYELKIMQDSHTLVDSIKYKVSSAIQFKTDSVNKDVKVENLFNDVSGHITNYLSRKDNFQNINVLKGASDESYRNMSQDFISGLTYKLNDSESDPWYSADASTQTSKMLSYKDTETKIYDLIGKPYDDPLWEKLLDQLTVKQMSELIASGNYRTIQLENIGKPLTVDADGPMGFALFMGDSTVYDTCYYASECVLGATWNAQLALALGKMVGNEGIIGNEAGSGEPYSGWYAPAVNIHRSQFGGRNFEYYSEDGLLSGRLAENVVKGAKEKGVYTYVKHFALNEQETNRDTTGLITWANEQSMREIYFKPFEMCVKEGKTTAMMSSFTRLGKVWAGGSYNLLTKLLREEWGFQGMVITDFNLKSYMNVDQMIRAGGDLNLSPNKPVSSSSTTTDIAALRAAAKNILFTVANSNAMNGSGENVIWAYSIPWWVVWMIVADCGVFAICSALTVFIFIRKKKENLKNNNLKEIR